MTRKLDWRSAVLGAILAIVSGMVLFKLQEKSARLTYVIYDAPLYSDSSGALAVYRVSILAGGDLPVRSVVARVSLSEGRVQAGTVRGDPTIQHVDSLGTRSLETRVAVLNPGETIDLSLIARGDSTLPQRPAATVRGDGVLGQAAEATARESHGVSDALVVLLIGAWAGFLAAGIWRRNDRGRKGSRRSMNAHLPDPPTPPSRANYSSTSIATDAGKTAARSSPVVRSYGGAIFKEGPMPDGFEHLRPGMPLSVLLAATASNKPEHDGSVVKLKPPAGPFWLVAFYHPTHGHDPHIERAVFYFTKENSEAIRADAIKAFGNEGLEPSVLGRRLRWDDVAGFRVVCDEDMYSVRIAETLGKY